MGGEKGNISDHFKAEEGSPPRGRGKDLDSFCCAVYAGITPAWAGKRPSIAVLSISSPDHPRVGGEKAISHDPTMKARGSPPRGRGKVHYNTGKLHPSRITPAWAGKSSRTATHSRQRRDHPRVGGEKQVQPIHGRPGRGSPPRGRGKVVQLSTPSRGLGITPAWAGKSPVQCFFCVSFWDHPRVGGEKHVANFDDESGRGSPPRGRGKVYPVMDNSNMDRITPAWAGKSVRLGFLLPGSWDHPRVGGEKTKKIP